MAAGVDDTNVESFGALVSQVSTEALAAALAGASVLMLLLAGAGSAAGVRAAVRVAGLLVRPGRVPVLDRASLVAAVACVGVRPPPGLTRERSPRAPPTISSRRWVVDPSGHSQE